MTTFRTSREISASPDQVFAAFSDSRRLAGPDGRPYPNESVFAEIEPLTKVVVQHVSNPKYRLIITLIPSAEAR
jgi:hypothetical protein